MVLSARRWETSYPGSKREPWVRGWARGFCMHALSSLYFSLFLDRRRAVAIGVAEEGGGAL